VRSASWLAAFVAVTMLSSACEAADPTAEDRRGTLTERPSPAPTEVLERADWRLREPAQGTELDVVLAVPSPGSCGSFERVDVSEADDLTGLRPGPSRRVVAPVVAVRRA
jgi:hypothetical protein